MLSKLCLALVQRGAITLDNLYEGYQRHSDQLDDLMIDVPLAPKLLADFYSTAVYENVFKLDRLAAVCEKIESGEGRRAYAAPLLTRMRTMKSEPWLIEQLKANDITLEKLFHICEDLDPPDLPSVEEFAKEAKLQNLPMGEPAASA